MEISDGVKQVLEAAARQDVSTLQKENSYTIAFGTESGRQQVVVVQTGDFTRSILALGAQGLYALSQGKTGEVRPSLLIPNSAKAIIKYYNVRRSELESNVKGIISAVANCDITKILYSNGRYVSVVFEDPVKSYDYDFLSRCRPVQTYSTFVEVPTTYPYARGLADVDINDLWSAVNSPGYTFDTNRGILDHCLALRKETQEYNLAKTKNPCSEIVLPEGLAAHQDILYRETYFTDGSEVQDNEKGEDDMAQKNITTTLKADLKSAGARVAVRKAVKLAAPKLTELTGVPLEGELGEAAVLALLGMVAFYGNDYIPQQHASKVQLLGKECRREALAQVFTEMMDVIEPLIGIMAESASIIDAPEDGD